MSYFIFLKNQDDVNCTLYRIAEDQSYLDNININKDIYKIIEVSQTDFNDVKYELKSALKYNGNNIVYQNIDKIIFTKDDLNKYIVNFIKNIDFFIQNNPNHGLFNLWNDYNNQLKSFNLDTLTYPWNKSLIRHFNDLGQSSLNPLQLP
jgi:hypothetical protein